MASQIAAEMAQLDSEWQTHLKEKSAAVKKADARLALVILADGLAATKAPETAKAMQSAAQDLKSRSNPGFEDEPNVIHGYRAGDRW